MKPIAFPFLTLLLTAVSALAQQKTVTIATANHPSMLELKKLSSQFEAANPDVRLNWLVLEQSDLSQRVTTDLSTGSGQFDLVFIDLYLHFVAQRCPSGAADRPAFNRAA